MKLKYLLFINLLLWILQSGFGKNVKPNIVFIMADGLGYTDLSCYGNLYHRTPKMTFPTGRICQPNFLPNERIGSAFEKLAEGS